MYATTLMEQRHNTMEERRNAIVELINHSGTVSFRQLKQEFPDVSEMTLRTDLKALDAEGRIVRIHGGARSVEQIIGTDGALSVRQGKNADAKELIAQKALGLIKPNTTVFLDSGSTTTALAKRIPDERLIIFTSGISCALELARLEQASVNMPGGQLNRFSMSLSGSRTIQSVQTMAFDQLFLGVTGYTDATGFACGSDEEANLKHACIERADEVVLLMDSSKVGARSTFSFCWLDDIDIIVSDGNLPESFVTRCQNAGIEII